MIDEETEIGQLFDFHFFLHRLSIQSDDNWLHHEDRHDRALQQLHPLDGLKIGICANRASPISIGQYHAYCGTFNLLQTLIPFKIRSVSGIRVRNKAIGIVTIHVPSRVLKNVIDVLLLVLQVDVPILLFMKETKENCLYISIQGNYVRFGQDQNPLSMENYFLIHRLKTEDTSFGFYIETDLATLHRTFAHLFLKALEMLLRHGNGASFRMGTVQAFKNISENCKIRAAFGSTSGNPNLLWALKDSDSITECK